MIDLKKTPFLKIDSPSCDFESILKTISTSQVDKAFDKIESDTLAKILFTSGSTGLPKGVMNTHGNMTTNLEQITQSFPFITQTRFRGKNVMKGYWRNPEASAKAFDSEGFYLTGDALKMLNPENPNEGLLFDGRIAEDFKMDTGTWVNVGVLKARLIAAGKGLIQDAVITGHDKSFLGAILFLYLNFCKQLAALKEDVNSQTIVNQFIVLKALQTTLENLAKTSTRSSILIRKAIFADFELSIDKGEITDKGSINQRMILANRSTYVNKMYT